MVLDHRGRGADLGGTGGDQRQRGLGAHHRHRRTPNPLENTSRIISRLGRESAPTHHKSAAHNSCTAPPNPPHVGSPGHGGAAAQSLREVSPVQGGGRRIAGAGGRHQLNYGQGTRAPHGTVNLSNPRAIFAGSPPRFTRSRVMYEAYVVSRTSTRKPHIAWKAPGLAVAGAVAIRLRYGYKSPLVAAVTPG